MPLLEGLGVAVALYALAARLFGAWSGVMASGLWLSTPVFVGFSHLDGIDVPFTLATLVVCLLLLRYLEAPSNQRAIALGLGVGASLLVRSVGLVLLFAVLVALVLAGRTGKRVLLFRRIGLAAFTRGPLFGS